MAEMIQHVVFGGTQDDYNVVFDSERIVTTVTNNHQVVTNWINDTLFFHQFHQFSIHSLVVGLHIEWYRQDHHRDNPVPVAVLQLCAGGRCLIFQLLHSPIIPYSLSEFLNHPTIAFVGVGIETYASRLGADYELWVRNCVNLADLSAYCLEKNELRFDGLKRLAWVVLRKVVAKPAEIVWSEWDSERLLPDQVAYASIHAFVSFQMGRVTALLALTACHSRSQSQQFMSPSMTMPSQSSCSLATSTMEDHQ
ncbi:hypothetical protein Scep_008841 [Stephania cephalantha]|uniref:3'-5' exonuclease domain-containing protein n=1 Tax=Stephania cephalantha TaxID=152367 RepID=A0AAP0JSY3_9MAGN